MTTKLTLLAILLFLAPGFTHASNCGIGLGVRVVRIFEDEPGPLAKFVDSGYSIERLSFTIINLAEKSRLKIGLEYANSAIGWILVTPTAKGLATHVDLSTNWQDLGLGRMLYLLIGWGVESGSNYTVQSSLQPSTHAEGVWRSLVRDGFAYGATVPYATDRAAIEAQYGRWLRRHFKPEWFALDSPTPNWLETSREEMDLLLR